MERGLEDEEKTPIILIGNILLSSLFDNLTIVTVRARV